MSPWKGGEGSDPRLSFRPARERDRVFLWTVHQEAMREHVERIWPWDEAEQLQRFLAGLDLPLTSIIRWKGADVGFLVVDEPPGEIYLRQISIRPAAQGKGVGTAVVRLLLQEGARSRRPVCLQVFKGNRARNLYSRLGFVITAETERHSQMKWSPSGNRGTAPRR